MGIPVFEKETAWHTMEVQGVLQTLDTNEDTGLSDLEAKARLNTYGLNELAAVEKVSPLRIFFKQFKNILLVILLVATAVSAILGETIDAIVIAVIVLFVVIMGFAQEYRAENALEALKQMLSPTCTVIRQGKEKEVPIREVIPGDIIVLKTGDKIPADLRLIETVNLQIDEATLTGESTPVTKTLATLPEKTPVADKTNMVFSGTAVTYGKGKGVIIATGMRTEFGKITKEVTTVTTEKTPLERRMVEIGRKLGLVALVVISIIALIEIVEELFIYGSIRPDKFLPVLMFGIALAVAAVPEALPAIVTGSLSIGMHIMAKKNALIRRMSAVETLGSTQIICTDKTGTLTRGEMTVKQVYLNNRRFEITGVGYEPTGETHYEGKPIDQILRNELTELARAVILCNDARLEKEGNKWTIKGDPTEGAMIVFAKKFGLDPDETRKLYHRLTEVPFSSERKRMTTVHHTSDIVSVAYMKGAPEVVLKHCRHILEAGQSREIHEEDIKHILKTGEEMAGNALRVLGIAKRRIPSDFTLEAEHLESDFIFLGLIGMIDPSRPDAIEAIRIAEQVGMKTIMITGDHKLTAVAIAKETGIYKEGELVLIGEELEQLSEEEFDKIVENVSVYARVSPYHKLRIVTAWKKKGRIVAMTGDGINDAPALKRSDIGISMGITGTDVTKETADMVLADDNFATIITAIELGRWVYDNIRKYLTYLLQANLVEIAVLSIGFLLIPRFMGFEARDTLPLLPVHILYINLATDGLPALALGFSPADPDLMKRSPRPKDEPVFTRDVKLFLISALLILTPILTLAFVEGLSQGIDVARTRVFLVFIFVELAMALNCRSLNATLDKARPHKWLILTTIWESLLIITLLHIPGIREALHILYPTLQDVIWIAGGILATFVSMESIKRARFKKSGVTLLQPSHE
jgi:Ca2+-transporting ATPase